MRCVVPSCKNDSRSNSKSEGITFHSFPLEPSLRRSWLEALGRADWKPKERSSVCSLHFMVDDLYMTPSGLRKVRVGAVPVIQQISSTQCEYDVSITSKICGMCLAINERLFSMEKCNLSEAFERLTGLSAIEDVSLPRNLCSQCATRLHNYNKFREKTLRVNQVMADLLKQHDNLTRNTLKYIPEDLLTPLLSKHINHEYNLILKYTDQDLTIDENNETKTGLDKEIVIKNEPDQPEIFVDDFSTKSESRDYSEVSENTNFTPELEITENTEVLELSESEKDALPAFDSEDSLPLEVTRKKKKKREPAKKKEKVKKTEREKTSRVNKEEQTEPKIDRRRKPFLNQDLNETLFTVIDLTVEEQIAEVMKRQETDNFKHAVFKCTECFKGFLDQDAYASHMVRHTSACGEHRCEICKTHFKQSHALRKHITAHHLQRFSCNHCPYVTTHRQTARLHERWHKGTKYQCPHCNLEFVKFTTYMGHVRIKHPSDFVCELYGYSFGRKRYENRVWWPPKATSKFTTYMGHVRIKHPLDFVCELCGYSFVSAKGIELHPFSNFNKFTTYMGHVRIKHPSDFVCELCGYSFVSAKGIELHKKLKHRGEDDTIPEDAPYCEPCNVRFVSPEAHHKHVSVSARHSGPDREHNKPTRGRKCREQLEREKLLNKDDENDEEKRRLYPSQLRRVEGPISCEQCGMELEDSRAYHGHFRRMHPDKNRTNYPSMKSPCMCEVCGRIFQSFALLKDHTWTHTGERPFKCDQCGKSFRMKQRLVAHRRVHSAARTSYSCGVCGKHFSTHSNRQRHMFIHTGLKPYKCEMCGKGFKHASEKRAHVTYVHLKKPWPKRARSKRHEGSPQQASASEMDVQPVWPTCDPKLSDINMIDDKPLYYR